MQLGPYASRSAFWARCRHGSRTDRSRRPRIAMLTCIARILTCACTLLAHAHMPHTCPPSRRCSSRLVSVHPGRRFSIDTAMGRAWIAHAAPEPQSAPPRAQDSNLLHRHCHPSIAGREIGIADDLVQDLWAFYAPRRICCPWSPRVAYAFNLRIVLAFWMGTLSAFRDSAC